MYTCFCAPCAYGAMAENKNTPDGVPGKVRTRGDALQSWGMGAVAPVPSAWLPGRMRTLRAAEPALWRSLRAPGARRTGPRAHPRCGRMGRTARHIDAVFLGCCAQGSCVQGTLCFMLFPHLVQVRCWPVCAARELARG
jgi:hypothetical protein